MLGKSWCAGVAVCRGYNVGSHCVGFAVFICSVLIQSSKFSVHIFAFLLS